MSELISRKPRGTVHHPRWIVQATRSLRHHCCLGLRCWRLSLMRYPVRRVCQFTGEARSRLIVISERATMNDELRWRHGCNYDLVSSVFFFVRNHVNEAVVCIQDPGTAPLLKCPSTTPHRHWSGRSLSGHNVYDVPRFWAQVNISAWFNRIKGRGEECCIKKRNENRKKM